MEKRVVNGKPNQVIIGFKHLQLRLWLEARPRNMSVFGEKEVHKK